MVTKNLTHKKLVKKNVAPIKLLMILLLYGVNAQIKKLNLRFIVSVKINLKIKLKNVK